MNILLERYVDKYESANSVLKTWNNENYNPLGECRVTVKNPKNRKKFNVKFVIRHNNFANVLSLRACEKMQLLKIKPENFEKVLSIENDYSNVFDTSRFGELEGECELKLKSDAKPVIMNNKKIPISVRNLLKQELDRLKKLKVIVPVDEPTAWVSQTVCALKKNSQIRLCLDPQELNTVLLREHYTMPTLDDILHELSDSTAFSKADLASGY